MAGGGGVDQRAYPPDALYAITPLHPLRSDRLPGLRVGDRELPAILVPSSTDIVVARARNTGKADGTPEVFVISHDYLVKEAGDQPPYLGLGARAMIVMNLGPLGELAGAEHPAGRAEHDGFTAGLLTALIAVNDDLDPAAEIPLTMTAAAPSFVALEVVV